MKTERTLRPWLVFSTVTLAIAGAWIPALVPTPSTDAAAAKPELAKNSLHAPATAPRSTQLAAPTRLSKGVIAAREANANDDAGRAAPDEAAPCYAAGDSPEERARDDQRYNQRLQENIEHLVAKAAAASEQGHPERAALMERRIDALRRQLEERASAS